MNRYVMFFLACLMGHVASAQTELRLSLSCPVSYEAAPVVVDLAPYGTVRSVLVTVDGRETPCQLDDLNNDGQLDELSFVADMKPGQQRVANVKLMKTATPSEYKAQTYAEIVLRNQNVDKKNKHDIYLSAISIDKQTTNPYNVLHHHGVAFENEMIAMRIYMDKRQTIDLYGKFHKGLELRETQFYTSKEQKAQGYGDDILLVGNSFGLGALRGWNGVEPTMLDDVQHRTQRIVTQGPVRTIVEVEDAGWVIKAGTEPVNMTIRYTLYTGHRDMDVDVRFNRDISNERFSTGVVNVKNSSEINDGKGLRGCWGTDWPAADTANWKLETVGMGVYVPAKYLEHVLPATKENYGMVVKPIGKYIHYSLAYTSDNENFGYHSAKEWEGYMKEWKNRLENPVMVKKLSGGKAATPKQSKSTRSRR